MKKPHGSAPAAILTLLGAAILLAALALLACVAYCNRTACPPPPPASLAQDSSNTSGESKPEETAILLARAQEVYDQTCSYCHGKTGKADGTLAEYMDPKPRNFVHGWDLYRKEVIPGPKYRLVSTENGVATEEDLHRSISEGMPGSPMPPAPELSSEETWGLVYYLRKLALDFIQQSYPGKEQFASEAIEKRVTPGPLVPVPEKPPVTGESLHTGKRRFVALCASCHDRDGRAKVSSPLETWEGNLVRARNLTAGIFKGGAQSEQLFRRIRTGVDPMPAHRPRELRDEEVWAAVHFVQQRLVEHPEAQERATIHRVGITAVTIASIPLEPSDSAWEQVPGREVRVMPYKWREERTEGIRVQAAYDGQSLGLRLTWEDATRNEAASEYEEPPDAVEVIFARGDWEPFYQDYEAEQMIVWRWQAGAGLELVTPGELEPEAVKVKAWWRKLQWCVVMVFPAQPVSPALRSFGKGDHVSLTFAVCDGEHGDNENQKFFTIWHDLRID